MERHDELKAPHCVNFISMVEFFDGTVNWACTCGYRECIKGSWLMKPEALRGIESAFRDHLRSRRG